MLKKNIAKLHYISIIQSNSLTLNNLFFHSRFVATEGKFQTKISLKFKLREQRFGISHVMLDCQLSRWGKLIEKNCICNTFVSCFDK